MGFDARKARSMTDAIDGDPSMPDALEVAARARPAVRANGQARRSAARRGVVDQGSVRHVRHAHHRGRGCVLCERSSAGRRDVREAAARGRRHHSREIQSRRVRVAHGTQLVRRHVLQSVRHAALSGRVERRIGFVGRCESRDLRDCRGDRRIDSHAVTTQQLGRHRADAGAGESRRHDRRGPEYAHRPDLPHRRGRRARARCHRGLRSRRTS